MKKLTPGVQKMYEWAKRNHKIPGSTILASGTPYEIGQVIMVPPYRFVISERLTQDEFMQDLRSHRGKQAHLSGVFTADKKPGDSDFDVTIKAKLVTDSLTNRCQVSGLDIEVA